MKVVHQHIYSVMILASLPYSLFANQTENFSRLNQIDATH
ncbi:TpsB transporter [Actinobacillus pleuropneumoniae]|nr:TpsB transporter [Actinobacillus pleuropneumoniae]